MGRTRTTWIFLSLAACILGCSAQPVNNLPVLKELPAEVFYRSKGPFVLECTTVSGSNQQVKYSWQKDGKPLDLKSQPDIVQKENEGSLIFTNTLHATGLYQCFAESEFGIASSRIVNVTESYLIFEKTTSKHKPVEGKPYKLDCAAPLAHPKPKITWVLQHDTDPSISHTVLDKRITQGPDGNLYFSNVTKEDANSFFKYVCQAESPATDGPVALAEHHIEAVVENDGSDNSELVPQYVSEDMVAKAGEVTMIYCIYGGTPLAHPDWFFEGKNVNNEPKDRITRYNRSAGKRLLIRDTYLSDQGMYTCEVNNEVGKPQKHSMRLTVVSAPKYSKKPESQMIVKEGEDVTISCQVSGLKIPQVSWTYNAKPLEQNNRVSVSSAGSNDTLSVADLTIKNVQKSDKGYYGCKSSNDIGNDYAETLLNVV